MNPTLVVVGDKFVDFTVGKPNVLTMSDFESMVWSQKMPTSPRIILGQGVCRKRLVAIKEVLRNQYRKEPVFINEGKLLDQFNPEQQHSVHKHRKENILITRPELTAPHRFRSLLILHDEEELLNDHTTGQHVQGMVITEAARQMMLSVTEHYFLHSEEKGRKYFVLNQVDSRFHQFAFPLDIEIIYRVTSLSRKRSTLHGEALVEFYQGSTCLAEVRIAYSVYDKSYITHKEGEKAAASLHACLNFQKEELIS
jgi:hypothetical protein